MEKDPGGNDTPEGAAAEAALTEAALTEVSGGQTADDADEAAQPEPAQEEEDEDELEGADIFAAIREEPGNVSVKSIEREAFKLGAIRAIELPDNLFADIVPAVLLAWRARVAAEAHSHLREHPDAIKVTLLAASTTTSASASAASWPRLRLPQGGLPAPARRARYPGAEPAQEVALRPSPPRPRSAATTPPCGPRAVPATSCSSRPCSTPASAWPNW